MIQKHNKIHNSGYNTYNEEVSSSSKDRKELGQT